MINVPEVVLVKTGKSAFKISIAHVYRKDVVQFDLLLIFVFQGEVGLEIHPEMAVTINRFSKASKQR